MLHRFLYWLGGVYCAILLGIAAAIAVVYFFTGLLEWALHQ